MSIKDNLVAIDNAFDPYAYPYIKDIYRHGDEAGCELYLVGGLIRDYFAKRRDQTYGGQFDIDFAVNKIPAVDFAQLLTRKMDGHFVLLDNKNDTARVVLEDGTYLDFAGCVGGSIEKDVQRRDFSINALVWSREYPAHIYDAFGGIPDIEAGKIVAVSKGNLVDDPLRLLRAFRFSAEFQFDIDESTLEYISEKQKLIETVPFERINYELFQMMEAEDTHKLLEIMGRLGLLESIFSCLKDTRKVTANQFHHLGLFEHSLEAVKQTEIYYQTAPQWVKDSASRELCQGISRLAATKIGCLLHDIGKPETWNVTPEGRHTFIGHDKLGASMVQELGKDIKWAKPLTRFVTSMVEWHLRPGQLFHQGTPTERAIKRFYRTVGEDLPELMLLAFGDLGATKGKDFTEDKRNNLELNFSRLLDGYPEYMEGFKTLPKLLDGKRLMELLNLKPGPVVGDLLESLQEAQVMKEVSNPEQAEVFVKELYQKKYSS